MTRTITETGNWNISGVAVVSLATWNVPARPAMPAPIANASSLYRTWSTPIAPAAISSSRIAIHARPTRDSWSRNETNTAAATKASPRK
jgi:hypothetical protein